VLIILISGGHTFDFCLGNLAAYVAVAVGVIGELHVFVALMRLWNERSQSTSIVVWKATPIVQHTLPSPMRVALQSDRTGPVPVPGLMQPCLRSRVGAAAIDEAVARKAMIVLERVMMAMVRRCLGVCGRARCLMNCCGRERLVRPWGWSFMPRHSWNERGYCLSSHIDRHDWNLWDEQSPTAND
jgi:hypothetical protein